MAFVTLLTTGSEPKTYELNKPRTVAGRDNQCDIHIDNLAISKQHFEIAHEGDAYMLRDLGSSNKTFVNNEEIKECRLKDGDEVVVGPYRIKFNNPSNAAPRDMPTSSDGFEPTLQLPPEMIRKKLEEMQKEKASSGTPPKVMTAKEYAAQASPPAAAGGDQQRASLVTAVIVGAIILIVVINVVLFMKFN